MRNKYKPIFLSFLVNGLGQIYNGDIRKGIYFILFSYLSLILIIGGIILIFLWLFNFYWEKGTFDYYIIWGIVLISNGAFWAGVISIWSMVDAYKCAKTDEENNRGSGNPKS